MSDNSGCGLFMIGVILLTVGMLLFASVLCGMGDDCNNYCPNCGAKMEVT